MRIEINIAQQQLQLLDHQSSVLFEAPVSTALAGCGEQNGSGKTPRGRHIVRAKIGGGAATNTVFVGRRSSGEIYSEELAAKFPERDWILTRILWLSGCEPGFNRLGQLDTMQRYIYLHGTPDSEPMGLPGSHGCIRMRNAAIESLFDLLPVGTETVILEHPICCA